MTTASLLIELGTEELPPKSLKTLATTFHQHIVEQLQQAELSFASSQWYATPRRLAVVVEQLEPQQQDKVIEKRGPSVSVAFDANGNVTKAAEGWARSNGITVEQAQRLVTDKGEWLVHQAQQAGQSVKQLVPDIVQQAINKLPIPRPMRWGSASTQFIRPVHTLTMMYGEQIIAGELLGVQSANTLQGHRFHQCGLIGLKAAEQYVSTLMAANVMADYQARQDKIAQDIKQAAETLAGNAVIDQDLLDEVTSLVEWPVVLVGTFDQEFLEVPAEPLISSMKDHQKYFPVFDAQGKLMNKFIFVSNIESKDPTQIVKGNEKVIRPRLADAEFFFKTDKKQSLEQRLASLETVLFQQQLGTLKAKSERIAALSQYVAAEIKENEQQAFRAGLLSKTDLMTEMVLEFPEVQGTMGKYYALNDGEAEAVAQALEDQYRPRFAGDELPKANIGCAVAIADKIDTLVGIFGINQPPKGDKDPFALRRAAIGLIRIIIEKQLSLDIALMVKHAISLYGDKLTNKNTEQAVIDFVMARFKAHYQEQSVTVDVINAVLEKQPTNPLDFDKRIKAVTYFKQLPEAETLAAANKRVGNILAKFDGELASAFNDSLAQESAEQALASRYQALSEQVNSQLAGQDYQAALTTLTGLKADIDNFFDQVMVMADDQAVKRNRLTLLNNIRNSFLQVADISQLQA